MNHDRLIFGVVILVSTILFLSPTASQRALAFTEDVKLTASDPIINQKFGRAVGISGAGTRIIVGAFGDDIQGPMSGAAYIFDFDGVSWTENGKLVGYGGGPGDKFGMSVSMSGTGKFAIVGARFNDDEGTNAGSAYLFNKRFKNSWVTQKITASDAEPHDLFGFNVAISDDGKRVIVGARADDDQGTDSGSAYIFQKSRGNWTETAKLTASDAASGDAFGWFVGISETGNRVIVGARDDDDAGTNSGSAYIFDYDGANWTETVKLTASDAATGDRFGRSVSMSNPGNRVIVGALYDDHIGADAGSAYIFDYDGTNWTETVKLTASDAASGDLFGQGVSISGAGDRVSVGARKDDDGGSDSGSAYIFDFDGVNWTEIAKLTASDAASGDQFGWYVSLSDTGRVVVGTPFHDDGGSNSGSAYIYDIVD